jgi:thiol-disulfide isomerase/thioredoxin
MKSEPNYKHMIKESDDEPSSQEEDALPDLRLDWRKLFGTLNKKRGIKNGAIDLVPVEPSILKAIPFVILFFSADWCPPCKGMLPSLNEFYKQVNLIDLEEKFGKKTFDEDGSLMPSPFERDFPNYS